MSRAMAPSVSVIIPVLRETQPLDALIDHLLQIADGVPVEMIVVDGSPDGESIRSISREGVTLITSNDPGYPERLRRIYDYPPLLYIKGRLDGEDIPVAIVGSRNASPYGRFVTERLSRELALRGVTVVSGGARGIDTAAHQGALTAKGRTIAVLGTIPNRVYAYRDAIANRAEFPPKRPD